MIERARDEDVIRAIRHRVAAFWRSVDAGEEPSPVMPADADALIRMHQYAQPGKILDASNDEKIKSLVAEYRAQCLARDRADDLAKVLKAELLQAIGDAEKVLLPGYTISASMVADTPPTVITPEMIGQSYGGRKGYRNFRINAKKN